jgi:predicted outer membrane lipoprotein
MIKKAIERIGLKALTIRMFVGATLGFVIIASLLSTVRHPNPAWGRFWYVRPLILVPLASAFGSLFFYALGYVKSKNIFIKIGVFIACLFAFIVALWMGIILGLDGTLWN